MKPLTKMYFLVNLLVIIISCQSTSCSKDGGHITPYTPPPTTPPDTTTKVVTPPSGPTYAHTYTLGTGSGNLTIDGKATSYIAHSLIVITPGNYGTINIQNLTGETIENGNGAVVMDGSSNTSAGINFTNCSNDTITRNPAAASTVPYGFTCQNNTYRPTTISGVNQNMLFEYIAYNNIGDYTIHISDATNTQTWDGTNNTLQGQNLKFLYCSFNNCNGGPMQIDGSVTASAVTGLQQGLEIGYCTFTNTSSGDLVFGGAVDQYSIHDNTLTNINATNNNDNGLFHMIGNGNYFRNYANNYQGHVIRMWTISFGSTPETNLVYDNVSIGSRKYSPFEWQSTMGDNIASAPNTTYVNIRLNNNIGGDLNTSQSTAFDAALVDNYSMPAGSTQEVYNNMLFNTFTSNGAAGRLFQWSSPDVETSLHGQGNMYSANSSAAGFNETTLSLVSNSPAYNAGVAGHLIIPTDYHNVAFIAANPTIGAIQ